MNRWAGVNPSRPNLLASLHSPVLAPARRGLVTAIPGNWERFDDQAAEEADRRTYANHPGGSGKKFRWITREDFHIDNLAEVPVEDDPPDIAGALKYLADTYAEFGMQRQAATMLREREWWLNRLSADDLDQVRRYIALNKQAILDWVWSDRRCRAVRALEAVAVSLETYWLVAPFILAGVIIPLAFLLLMVH